MADEVAQYIIRARNDASTVLSQVTSSVTNLRGAMTSFAAAAGPIGAVVTAVTAAGAAAIAGAVSLSNNVEQLQRLSSISGVSIDRLQVMQRVIREGGGDADSMSTSLVKLNRAIENGDPLLSKIGITSRDTFTAFMQLADIISKTTDAKTRDEIATRLLGRSGAEIIPDLDNLTSSFDRTHRSMKSVGSLITEDFVPAATQLDAQVDQLQSSWEDFALQVEKKTMPIIANLATALADLTRQMLGVPKTAQEIADEVVGKYERDIQGKTPDKARSYLEYERSLFVRRAAANPRDESSLFIIKGFNELIAHLDRVIVQPNLGGNSSGRRGAAEKPRDEKINPYMGDAPMLERSSGTRQSLLQERAGGVTAQELRDLESATRGFADSMLAVKDGSADLEAEATRAALALQSASQTMQGAVAADIDSAIMDLVRGTASMKSVVSEMVTSWIQDFERLALKTGIGLGLEALGAIPGLGWLAPVGGALTGAGGGGAPNTSGKNSMGYEGSVTYNISAISARDVVGQLTSPAGEMRAANVRVRQVAMASGR